MNFRSELKQLVECIPPAAGSIVSRVPYTTRLGPSYNRSRKDIAWFNDHSVHYIKHEIAIRVKNILQSACQRIPFYRDFYCKHRIDVYEINTFDDISLLPITTKGDLKAIDLRVRSVRTPGCMRINTGGTSGESLHFYIDRNAFAREWGHMHFIWEKLGYRTKDLKLTFRGKNLGKRPIRYNALHNEYLVNGYLSHDEIVPAVRRVVQDIRFIHGYPSSIYEFVKQCLEKAPDLLSVFRKNLKGILYGSEYPAPAYRDLVEATLQVPSISWYGHSEMAILAYETEPYVYKPLHSYGFCEAVPDTSGSYRLVGTSYYNDASPFIRYDTGDYVDPLFEDGLLRSFRVKEGRVGDFIVDAQGHRISLTALIFGRHHSIFEIAKFVQVFQDKPGRATLLVTANPSFSSHDQDLERFFDVTNVNIEFSVKRVDEPVRTPTGKVPLLVSDRIDQNL